MNVALLAERGMEGEDTGAMNRGWPCRRPGRTTRWGTGTTYDRLKPRVEVWGTTVRLIKKSRGHEVCCHGVAVSGQGETVGSICRNGELADGKKDERTNERTNRRRSTKTTIDAIDRPTRVQQTGHSEQSWRRVMTLSGIVKIGVGSGFPERPPRWLGKGKRRRQTDGCESRVRQRCVRSGNVLSKCCRWDYFGGVLHRTRETGDRAALPAP